MSLIRKVNLASLRKRLAPWERVGFQVWKTGTLVYGSLDTGRGRGWLHMVYPPIPAKNLRLVTDEAAFIKQYPHLAVFDGINGLTLFSGALKLYGVHAHGVPLGGPGIPFNIFLENINFTPHVERHNGLVIGSAKFGPVMRLYIETEAGRILSVDEDTSALIHHWPDFQTFFWSEIDRLETHFTAEGQLIDAEAAAVY